MRVDRNKLREYVDKKLVSEQKHPEADLYIYNYTPVCQFGKNWDEITLMCRGLITDEAGNIVARPFRKFFNYGEYHGEIPATPFSVLEKMDGSLGILYWANHKPQIATRGSFTSEQALKGTEMLHEYCKQHGYEWLDKPLQEKLTYLFEIIYPQNRIVVNYGDREELVLLAVIDNATGNDRGFMDPLYKNRVVEHPPLPIDQLMQTTRPNAEGYVLHWPGHGLRLKIKHDEYVRLHRIITGVSNKSIWDMLRRDETLDDILDNIPDEFYDWVMGVVENLQTNYFKLKDEAMEAVKNVPQGVSRREQAAWIKEQPNPHLIFSLLDGHVIDDQVWRMLKPKYEQPFKKDIDL